MAGGEPCDSRQRRYHLKLADVVSLQWQPTTAFPPDMPAAQLRVSVAGLGGTVVVVGTTSVVGEVGVVAGGAVVGVGCSTGDVTGGAGFTARFAVVVGGDAVGFPV